MFSDNTPIGPPGVGNRPGVQVPYHVQSHPQTGYPHRSLPQPYRMLQQPPPPAPPGHNFGGGPMPGGFPALNHQQIEQLKELLQAQGVPVAGAGGAGTSRSGAGTLMGKSGAALTAANLVEPRVAHLEEKMKEALDRLSSMAVEKQHDAPPVGFVRATVLLDTSEYLGDGDAASAVKTAAPTKVAKGTALSLCYPQSEVEIDGEAKILMRRRSVDADTAQLSYSWIVVYVNDSEDEELDVAYVGQFEV